MTRVFETAECEEARSSIFFVHSYKMYENQMKGCAALWLTMVLTLLEVFILGH